MSNLAKFIGYLSFGLSIPSIIISVNIQDISLFVCGAVLLIGGSFLLTYYKI